MTVPPFQGSVTLSLRQAVAQVLTGAQDTFRTLSSDAPSSSRLTPDITTLYLFGGLEISSIKNARRELTHLVRRPALISAGPQPGRECWATCPRASLM